MIGLDANILVRYLAQDDPVQSPKATELIERQLTGENPGFVSVVHDGRSRMGARSRLWSCGPCNRHCIERALRLTSWLWKASRKSLRAMIAIKKGARLVPQPSSGESAPERAVPALWPSIEKPADSPALSSVRMWIIPTSKGRDARADEVIE